MRRFSWLVAAMVLLLSMAACASEEPATPESADDPVAAGGEADASPQESDVESGKRVTSIVDDAGRVVDLEVPVDSAIAFNTRNLEFVRSIDAMDAIVAITEGDARQPDYWPEVDPSVTVGNQGEPNWEQIVALDPDVVILPSNGAWEEAIERLDSFDIPVLVLTGWDLVKHEHTVSNMGIVFGRQDEAEAVNAFFNDYRTLLEERLEGVERKRVYLENNSELESPVPGSGWHDMIEMAGGVNIFEDIGTGQVSGAASGSVHSFPIDAEAVLLREPQLVVKLYEDHGYEPPEEGALEATRQNVLSRPGWSDLPAAQNGAVHVMTGFPGNASSKIIGALYLATWMYPDLLEDVDPDEAMREWIEDFQGMPLPEPEAYRTDA